MEISEQTLRKVIHETVVETLTGLGFDTKDPQYMQADLYYLRKLRRGSEEMTGKVKTVTVSMLLSAVLVLLWQAFKNQFVR